MKSLLSPGLVKRSLSSHSWIGLAIGALMYLVCLSGTLVVFYPALERWEQPAVAEFESMAPEVLEQAYSTALAEGLEPTHHMYLGLPSEEMPRATLSSEDRGWFLNADGSLGEPVDHSWTHLLIHLHTNLHIPGMAGLVFVSILGALLCGLVVSGFLAHPGIFRDAFSFRRHGSRRLEQVDLHNRLSVWGAPFHLMIAITGAFFGLSVVFALAASSAFFSGDPEDVSRVVYGDEPTLTQTAGQPAIARTLRNAVAIDPDHPPFSLIIEHADAPDELFMVVQHRFDDRLIWSEQRRFDAHGNHLDTLGYADGDAGRQVIFSVYRLHFGHYGGWLVQIAYLVLGLALTVIAASGINIWLARRKTRTWLNNAWTGIVWGAPATIALTAVTEVLFDIPSTAILWLGLVGGIALAQTLDDDALSRAWLQTGTAGLLLALVTGHYLLNGKAAFSSAALGVNLALVALTLCLLCMGGRALRDRVRQGTDSLSLRGLGTESNG